MKKKDFRILIVILSLMILPVLASCSNKNQPESYKELVECSLVEKISENMTMKEVFKILGKNWYCTTGKDYPFSYTWDLSDGSKLVIEFKSDTYSLDELMKKIHDGEFAIQDENTKNGLTPNELKVMKEWRQNTKAVYAYIETPGKDDVILFAQNS